MEKLYAITLDVGSSLANKTGSRRTERAVYVDRLPPCNHACPAGENIQQWSHHAEEGGEGYERAWRQIMEDNPFPAIMGRVCYHPCETSCNRGQLDEAVGINWSSAFSATRGSIGAGAWSHPPSHRASGCWSSAPALGPLGCLLPGEARARGDDPRGRPDGRGMMRFWIPKYWLPRDVLDAEVERILGLGVTLEFNSKVTNVVDATSEDGRRRLPSGRRSHRQAGLHPRGQRGARARSRLDAAQHRAGEKPLLGRARRRLRRRRHGDGRGADGEAPRRG